ncbi:MAG: VWA domain-containing protein [Deltaproteobacteria bacterium]|jgi:Ca-activated chloride channel family protein|nr:VWA domain-containing protein [Deltaproteobacteria bacterium]
MRFVNPYMLNLLWTLIIVFGIMVYGILRRKKIVASFAKSDILHVIAPKFDPKKTWFKACLIIIASAFALIALAGPQMGFKWQKTNQKGVDIMIALDCSKSMLAQDIKPNRLERAKREIIDLLHMMRSDRAGLVAFSGQAILQCPLTLDHETFNIFLKVLNPGFLPVGGTNIGQAIKECYKGFEKESDTKKAIIIITDGESTTGDVELAAKEMAKEDIKIFCIGVGDLAGAPIPDEKGGFIKDSKGNIILSKVDEKGLEKIADLTGGLYVRSVAGDMDLDMIYKDKIIGTMERKTLTSGKKKVWENRFQWFLFPALILLLIELFLSTTKRIKPPKKILSIIVFVSALTVCLLNYPLIVEAKTVSSSVKSGISAFDEQNYQQAKKHFIDAQLEDPENRILYYNIGAAAYMNKEYDQAKTNLKQALESDDKKLRHDAGYNLANTHYRLGNLEDAIKEYENILREFPEDIKTKENLEFVKKKKEEQKQQKSKSDKNQKENKKENKKDKSKKDKDKEKSDKEQEKDQNKNQKNNQEKNQQKDKEKQQKPSQSNQKKDKDMENTDLQNMQQKQSARNMENMLNRLEDKPGKAMIPVLEKKYIEKDW